MLRHAISGHVGLRHVMSGHVGLCHVMSGCNKLQGVARGCKGLHGATFGCAGPRLGHCHLNIPISIINCRLVVVKAKQNKANPGKA